MRRTLIPILALTTITFSFGLDRSDASSGRCESEIAGAATRHDVPIAILYAVGLTESGRDNRLHQFALNIEGETHFPAHISSARQTVRKALRNGRTLIDIGCMQINHKYHAARFANLDAMFEPSQNVDYAARFLKRLKRRHGTWSMAVARYHAGAKNEKAQKKYVCRVLRQMIRHGLAKWTESSEKICKSTR